MDFILKSPKCTTGFNKLILTRYLRQFLLERNQIIKDFAESDKWRQILK